MSMVKEDPLQIEEVMKKGYLLESKKPSASAN
jgi:hypothetical protein